MNKDRQQEALAAVNAYGRYAGLGFQFVASMGVLGLLGYWLDGRLGTRPWLMIVGIFLGAAGGFYSLLLAIPSGHNSGNSTRRQTPPGEGSDET